MNLTEFHDHLDRWGANLDAWPAPAAAAGRALLDTSADARASWHTARAIDRHLSGQKRHHAPPSLTSRITAARRGALEQLWWPLWRPALIALLPLTLGFAVGLQSSEADDPALQEGLLTLALDASLYRNDLYLELDDEQP
jgi:hypothetical protein